MAFPIERKYTCPSCGWSRIKTTSDSVKMGDILRTCPSCDAPLKSETLRNGKVVDSGGLDKFKK